MGSYTYSLKLLASKLIIYTYLMIFFKYKSILELKLL